MMPALAFFEAGLLRRKNTLSLLTQIFVGLSVLALLWHIFGFSLVYGPDHGFMIGDLSYIFFKNINNVCLSEFAPRIPGLAFALFQMMFAAITPLLMTGNFLLPLSLAFPSFLPSFLHTLNTLNTHTKALSYAFTLLYHVVEKQSINHLNVNNAFLISQSYLMSIY
jgi:hypothetical protein